MPRVLVTRAARGAPTAFCHLITLMAALGIAWRSASATPPQGEPRLTPREARVPVGHASLYVRDIGNGPPVIVLHGGPDFDQSYLAPDLDRWADGFHVISYDQRGRGRSADQVRPTDVTLASDLDDLDRVRRHFGLESAIVLGHSWGTVLALEYARRHPSHVSHLLLMNPAPASARDYALLRETYTREQGTDLDRQQEIMAGSAYQEGDPAAVTARYRLHFKSALKEPRDYETLMERMQAGFINQGKEGIVEARAVEDRLMQDTWARQDYDILPELRELRIPTLVLYGDHDFIPNEIARHIAGAMPDARLVILKDCGHFAHLECAEDVRREVDRFLQRTR
jgi:proline iminopeptidase